MSGFGSCRFDTVLGSCSIGWTPNGICEIRLPGDPSGAPDVPADLAAIQAFAVEAMNRIRKHFSGCPQDFVDLPVDLSGVTPFGRKVLAACREIPAGAVATYGNLATRIGNPAASRAVGGALGNNPVPIVIPCHRVLASGGRPGGFSAPGGAETKVRLLAIEGVALPRRP